MQISIIKIAIRILFVAFKFPFGLNETPSVGRLRVLFCFIDEHRALAVQCFGAAKDF